MHRNTSKLHTRSNTKIDEKLLLFDHNKVRQSIYHANVLIVPYVHLEPSRPFPMSAGFQQRISNRCPALIGSRLLEKCMKMLLKLTLMHLTTEYPKPDRKIKHV